MSHWSGRVATAPRRPWRGLSGAGGSVGAAPQARAGKSKLPRSAWIISGVLMRSSPCLAVPLTCLLYVCDVINCTCISRAAHFGAELGDIIVGSSRGVAICGEVRACTLHGREHCAGGGCPGRTWRERHTEGLRACCPRASDRSRVKKRIHPTTAHFACDHPDVGQARASQHGHVG